MSSKNLPPAFAEAASRRQVTPLYQRGESLPFVKGGEVSKLTPNVSQYYNGNSEEPKMYEERTYRNLVKTDDLVKFEVMVKETDLFICAERDLTQKARESVLTYRHQLETYIAMKPDFEKSLVPLKD